MAQEACILFTILLSRERENDDIDDITYILDIRAHIHSMGFVLIEYIYSDCIPFPILRVLCFAEISIGENLICLFLLQSHFYGQIYFASV